MAYTIILLLATNFSLSASTYKATMAPIRKFFIKIMLQEGDIIESHYLVERRNRTIYKRMREYLYELKHNPSLITSIIPLGDGVTVSVKQE